MGQMQAEGVQRHYPPLLILTCEGEADGAWNWHSPCLAVAKVSLEDKARVLVHVAVNLVLVPLVRQGTKRAEVVRKLCTAMASQLKPHLKCDNPVLRAALEDVSDICLYLEALTSEGAPSLEGMTALTRITRASSGCKLLMRNAVGQSTSYAKAEAESRRFEQAAQTYMPKLEEIEAALAKKTNLQMVSDALASLPRWKDALRQGVASALDPHSSAYSPVNSIFLDHLCRKMTPV